MPADTIFHKIVRGDLPANVVYEDEDVLIFKDLHPKMTTHLLIIAKKKEDFVPSIADLTDETNHVPGMLIGKAKEFAKVNGIDGYQLRFHVGAGGGQEVFYLHLHFMSPQSLPA